MPFRFNKAKLLIFILFISIIFYALQPSLVQADPKIWFVDDIPGTGPNNPNEDFTNIQDAIDHASSNDIIYIYNGWYIENIRIDKPLTITGQHHEQTIIDGNHFCDVIRILEDHCMLSNVTIQNSGDCINQVGIENNADHTIITNCIIHNCSIGITAAHTSGTKIKNCRIHHCTEENGAIDLSYYNKHSLIIQCCLYQNHGYGISSAYASKNITIDSSNIFQNQKSGIYLKDTSDSIITNCMIYENNLDHHSHQGGICLAYLHGNAKDNQITHTTIHENIGYGIYK